MSQDVVGEDAREAQALALANRGIAFGAEGDHEAAREAWQEALGYAEAHLPDSTIVPWIQSGLASALLKTGDDRGALEMAGAALAFCASVGAPIAALTMAEASLHLGDLARARDYARQACALKGERVLDVLDPADRAALAPGAPS